MTSQSMNDLFAAIESGDLPVVRTFLESDPALANAVDHRPPPKSPYDPDPLTTGAGLPAKPPEPRPSGNTALHIAVRHSQLEVAHLLVAYGANVNAVNAWRVTPLDAAMALSELRLDLVRFLVESGADIKTHMLFDRGFSFDSDPLPVIEYLLEKGVDVNATRKPNGRTLLGLMIPRMGFPLNLDYVPIIETLLRHGAKVNPDLAEKSSPLYTATLKGCVRVAHLLIAAGADPNSRLPWGYPLHAAAVHGSHELVEVLLAAGADPFVVDQDGKTPLDLTQPYEEALQRMEHLLNGQTRSEP
jgi:ankyrin repeat protein